MTDEEKGPELLKLGLGLTLISGLWLTLAPILGHMDRPWPCFVLGLAIFSSIAMAWLRPGQRRGWAVVVMLFAAMAFLTGTNAIVPGLLGIGGAGLLVEWS